ncbi:MAG: HemK family protein methyltransferase, partial [Clostridia bacterium]|nr:HemK family protein methyltransferase [Clostridia bacterium]
MVTTRRDLFFEARTAIPERNAAFEARELLLRALSITKDEYYLRPSAPVTPEEEARFRALLQKRLEGTPLAYLLGEWDFYGRTFTVTPDVLIPRPETEELVEEARFFLSGSEKVLDLCTGSGCVGITLALEIPGLEVVLGDVSEPALRIAEA